MSNNLSAAKILVESLSGFVTMKAMCLSNPVWSATSSQAHFTGASFSPRRALLRAEQQFQRIEGQREQQASIYSQVMKLRMFSKNALADLNDRFPDLMVDHQELKHEVATRVSRTCSRARASYSIKDIEAYAYTVAARYLYSLIDRLERQQQVGLISGTNIDQRFASPAEPKRGVPRAELQAWATDLREHAVKSGLVTDREYDRFVGHVQGRPFREIGEEAGVDKGTVCRTVQKVKAWIGRMIDSDSDHEIWKRARVFRELVEE